MTETVTFDLPVLLAYSFIIFMMAIFMLHVCCNLICRANRDLVEFKVSASNPAHVLTVRAPAGDAKQLLEHLVDRVFLQVDPRPEPAEDPVVEPAEEPAEELDSGPSWGSNQNVVTTALVHCSDDPSPPAAQDPTSSSDTSHYSSVSSRDGPLGPLCEEEEEEEEEKQP